MTMVFILKSLSHSSRGIKELTIYSTLSGDMDEVTEISVRTFFFVENSYAERARFDVMLSAMRYEYEHHSLFTSMSRHNPKLHALSHRLLLFSHPDPPFGNMSHTSCGDFFSLSWKTLRVCTACVFLWCFMIYACIKWIFCYFFWCFNASLPFFVCPKTASSSLNIKAHHSNALCSASLTWALNTHHISIPPAEHSLFRFHMPPFLWHTEISFAGAFSTPKRSLLLMTPCVLVTRAAQLHNIDVI